MLRKFSRLRLLPLFALTIGHAASATTPAESPDPQINQEESAPGVTGTLRIPAAESGLTIGEPFSVVLSMKNTTAAQISQPISEETVQLTAKPQGGEAISLPVTWSMSTTDISSGGLSAAFASLTLESAGVWTLELSFRSISDPETIQTTTAEVTVR